MHAQAAHRAEQGLQSTSRHPREAGPQLPPRVIISPRALDAAGGADVVEVGAQGAKEGLDSCGAPGSFAAAAEPAWTVKKGESWLERAQRLQVLSATSRGSSPATHGAAAGHAVGSGGSGSSDDEGGWVDAGGGMPGGRSASSSRGSRVSWGDWAEEVQGDGDVVAEGRVRRMGTGGRGKATRGCRGMRA